MRFYSLLFLLFTSSFCLANPTVKMETSEGDIEIEIFSDKTPITAKNFLKYVNADFYTGTVFHRVISTFMIQGGGYEMKGNDFKQKKPLHDPIQNEAKVGVAKGASNKRGYIAMARTRDPHSASSQFFINVVDNSKKGDTPYLDYPSFDKWGYAVFGKVTSGMKVVDKIRNAKIDTKVRKSFNVKGEAATLTSDVPLKTITIKKMSIVPTPKPKKTKK